MFAKLLIFIIIFSVGFGFGSKYVKQNQTPEIKQEKNTAKAFISEIYDKIKENYWNNISDAELQSLFKSATDKNGGQVNTSNAAQVAQTVLASLNPPGRSGLFTTKQEQELKNKVENRNPQTGEIEPTIFTKVIGSTLYVQFKKFSPTSLDEFIKAFDTYKESSLSSLILDLRGNVGGAIDSTAYFLGHFIGKNQSAFDFYHKGEYLPFKTPTDKLSSITKYKQVVILVDNQTQSSAEMMAASLKKYHVGVVVGVPTKGWGTVERVFPLDNQIDPIQKYSMFLVHSITVREDNQPIEGRGVEPDININSADWQKELFTYFRNQELVQAISSLD